MPVDYKERIETNVSVLKMLPFCRLCKHVEGEVKMKRKHWWLSLISLQVEQMLLGKVFEVSSIQVAIFVSRK